MLAHGVLYLILDHLITVIVPSLGSVIENNINERAFAVSD